MNSSRVTPATIDAAGFAIVIAGALALYFLGITPAQRARAQDEADCQALVARRADLDAARQDLAKTRDKLESMQRELAESTTELKPGGDLFTRIQSIMESSQQYGLTISEISPSTAIAGKRFSRIPIHLSGVGAYPSVSKFVAMLHEKYADLELTSLRIAGRADDAHTPPRFDAELNWFTIGAAPKPAGSGAGSGGAGGADGGASNGLAAPAGPLPQPRG